MELLLRLKAPQRSHHLSVFVLLLWLQQSCVFISGKIITYFFLAGFWLLLERSDGELSYEMTGKHLQSSTEVRGTPWRKAFMLCANSWAPIQLPLPTTAPLSPARRHHQPSLSLAPHFPSSTGLSSLAWNSGINLTDFPSRGLILQFSWWQVSCWFQQKWYLKMNGRIIPFEI